MGQRTVVPQSRHQPDMCFAGCDAATVGATLPARDPDTLSATQTRPHTHILLPGCRLMGRTLPVALRGDYDDASRISEQPIPHASIYLCWTTPPCILRLELCSRSSDIPVSYSSLMLQSISYLQRPPWNSFEDPTQRVVSALAMLQPPLLR
ncbi:hypothetical protein BC834DRAFT_493576 [Gloeopeniophorella convolvens]|nr:hypothetical protein BC834DRAFT_493576 [Gloeopeniophorella convolvens]